MIKLIITTLISLLLFGTTYGDESIEKESDLDSIRVNLKVKNIPLRDALQQLVAQTKLQIIFNDALVQDIKVSCSIKNLTLRKALKDLLKNTKLTFKALKDGQIVIIKRKQKQRINLKGFIKDAVSGETLPYANITIKGTSTGTASNMNGYFVLLNVSAEHCTLKVHYIGYEDVELPIIADNSQNIITIELKQKVIQGSEVTVKADNFKTMEVANQPSLTRISPLQISSMPSIGEVDIFRTIQLLPGIGNMDEGSTGLFVRGGTPDQNLILFDGMTIYHVDHFFGFVSTFNAEAVKDVQVFKGGFPAKFGNRISGVIELTGKTGSINKFIADAKLNLLSGSGTVQLPIKDRGALLLSFRRSYTDYLKSDLYINILDTISKLRIGGNTIPPGNGNGNQGNMPDNRTEVPGQFTSFMPDFYYYDLISKFSYLFSSNDFFSLSFYRGRDHLDQSQNIVDYRLPQDTTSANMQIDDITKWENIGLSAKWSKRWNDRIYTNLLAANSLYSSENIRDKSGQSRIQNSFFSFSEQNKIRNISFRIDNEYQVNKSHRIEFGTQLSKNKVDLLFTASDTVKNLDRNDDATQISFYFQDKWKINNSLEFSPGIRTTYYLPTTTTYFEPRASFKLFVSNKFSLKGAWGEYHQFINRITNENAFEGNRDFWLLADERLKPSFAEHKILGATYENSAFLFDIETYHKNLNNISEFSQRFHNSPKSELGRLFYTGEGTSKGIEFLAQKKSSSINGWMSYTLAKVEYQIPYFNHGNPFPANHDRRHELNFVANYNFRKWTLAATYVYSSGTPYTEPEIHHKQMPGSRHSIHYGDRNAKRLPAYQRMDISLSRKFSLAGMIWDIGLSVFNIFDHTNVLYREYILDADPVTVRDVTALGFTPTVNLKIDFN